MVIIQVAVSSIDNCTYVVFITFTRWIAFYAISLASKLIIYFTSMCIIMALAICFTWLAISLIFPIAGMFSFIAHASIIFSFDAITSVHEFTCESCVFT